MLIDDDSIFVWLTKNLLEAMQIVERVECFTNPEHALDYLTKLSSSKESMDKYCPELIFLDINMPGIDGFEFLGKLKEMPGCQDVAPRIVMLSSSMLHLDMLRAISYGVHSYLVKPLTETKTREIVRSLTNSLPQPQIEI